MCEGSDYWEIDRLLEARKIWGAIVNSSRMWGSNVKHYVTNQFRNKAVSEAELKAIHRKLLYRHVACETELPPAIEAKNGVLM